MRSIIYLFIAIVSVCLGIAAYFLVAFTPIEAGLLGLSIALACLLAFEVGTRRREIARLDQEISDLSRLHAREAASNQDLWVRVDKITDLDLGNRTEVIEADMSVLGTVVRQVAEATADMEERLARQDQMPETYVEENEAAQRPETFRPEPVIPPEMVRQAVEEGRLVFHLQPIVTLPQRRTECYDLVPRLVLEDGEWADMPDFLPRRGETQLVCRIERLIMQAAIAIVRRATTREQPMTLLVPLTRASLTDRDARAELVAALDANRIVAQNIVFAIDHQQFVEIEPDERDALDALVAKGAHLCIDHAYSLRLEIPALAGIGVRFVKVPARTFINDPGALTDFHTGDVAAYLERGGISLIARDIVSEDQILALLDDGVPLAQGDHIAPPAPTETDIGDGEGDPASSETVHQLRR